MTDSVKILVIGSSGQIGVELTAALRARYGGTQVISSDRNKNPNDAGPFMELDVLDLTELNRIVSEENITQIYHLAAMLSANGEKNIDAAWDLNVKGLINVLKVASDNHIDKLFWPSSIAVFGPASPKNDCPQETIIEPDTMYGISKRSGELWCKYYFEKFGLDVRSLRFPGLISYTSGPGGGTTDYAVDIFHKAFSEKKFTSFLKADTCLPMMYMPDAIRAMMELMEAPKDSLSIHTSYNIAAFSFTPQQLADEIKKIIPAFEISFDPDFRQGIADSWPESIEDTIARKDWGWTPQYDLSAMVKDMISNLKKAEQTELLLQTLKYNLTS